MGRYASHCQWREVKAVIHRLIPQMRASYRKNSNQKRDIKNRSNFLMALLHVFVMCLKANTAYGGRVVNNNQVIEHVHTHTHTQRI